MSDSPNKTVDEMNEPGVGQKQSPMWLFVVLILGAWLGGIYLDRQGGGFHAAVYDPYPSHAYLDRVVPKGDFPPNYDEGRQLYNMACLPCHQPHGGGAPGVAPPLAGSEWVLAPKPDRLARIAYNGLQGPVEVKGETWNLAMLAMGQQMAWSDEQVAAILTFIRMNPDWGNDAGPVAAEDIADAMADAKKRGSAWTASELQSIPAE